MLMREKIPGSLHIFVFQNGGAWEQGYSQGQQLLTCWKLACSDGAGIVITSYKKHSVDSLVPRPHHAFCHLQYRKAGRTGCVSHIVQPTTRSTLSLYNNIALR